MILTAERVAELCGCTVATINRKASEIGGRKVGRAWVFTEEKVLHWINAPKKSAGRPRRRVT